MAYFRRSSFSNRGENNAFLKTALTKDLPAADKPQARTSGGLDTNGKSEIEEGCRLDLGPTRLVN